MELIVLALKGNSSSAPIRAAIKSTLDRLYEQGGCVFDNMPEAAYLPPVYADGNVLSAGSAPAEQTPQQMDAQRRLEERMKALEFQCTVAQGSQYRAVGFKRLCDS